MLRRIPPTAALLVTLGLAACGADAVSPVPVADTGPVMASLPRHHQPISAGVNRDLAAARSATAAFHDYETAREAGFVRLDLPCVEGQGFHYAKLDRIDGIADVKEPEVLMYEPQKNGKMRLVGIEYVAPGNEPQPSLYERQFHENEALGIWALHVWIWRHNPLGMFADGNPHVSCKYAVSN